MRNITVAPDFWVEPRLSALGRLFQDQDKANGLFLRAMQLAQKYWVPSHGELKQLIPKQVWDLSGLSDLLKVGLAEMRDEGVYLKGSEFHFQWLVECVLNGRKGGAKSAESRLRTNGTNLPNNASNITSNPKPPLTHPVDCLRKNPKLSISIPIPISENTIVDSPAIAESTVTKKSPVKKSKPKTEGSEVWQAYAAAYLEKYKVSPPPNLKSNIICKKLAGDYGLDDAIAITKKYLNDRDSYAANACHAISLLPSRAQKYFVEISRKNGIETVKPLCILDSKVYE